MKVSRPWELPISATPAAEPIKSLLPQTPRINVTSSHWKRGLSGCLDKTENKIRMLPTIAEAKQVKCFIFSAH